MEEVRKPFGIVAETMKEEVESYLNDLLSRSITYIHQELIPNKMAADLDDGNIPSTPENTYASVMQKRNLPAALVWKSVLIQSLRAEADGIVYRPNEQSLKQRLIILLQMIQDDVNDMIDNTDFSFIETLSDDEVKHELAKAYEEDDIPAIVFFIATYMLKQKMGKIGGVD